MKFKFICISILLIIFTASSNVKNKSFAGYKKKCNSPPTPIYCTEKDNESFCAKQPTCHNIAVKYSGASSVSSVQIYCQTVRAPYPDDNPNIMPSTCRVAIIYKGKNEYNADIRDC